jgi:hypothetical protein
MRNKFNLFLHAALFTLALVWGANTKANALPEHNVNAFLTHAQTKIVLLP